MIAQTTIDLVREIDLLTVISKYATLKKKGANHAGPCPFHDEKTGSFTVSPTKNVYKCFGCGKGGNNPIAFIMDKENMEFPTAVKYLADWFNITVEETKSEEPEEQRSKRADQMELMKYAAEKYRKNLFNMITAQLPYQPLEAHSPVTELILNRQLTLETIIQFQIGFAPKERFLAPNIKERGLLMPAEEIGLVKVGDNGSYDVQRERIIFPIQNERGEVIGLGGRKMADDKKDNPKYINSPESLIYNKSNVLYGLFQAGPHIRKMKFACVVEGYYDVTGFHQAGMPNTVAPCGTSFTEAQAKILKKYTNHLVLIRDGDDAGNKANMRDVDMLLKLGFKVDICLLPDGQDPDSFARNLQPDVQDPEEEELDEMEVAA
jgi:DNA primase